MALDREAEELRAFEPLIAPSVNFDGSLFCSLTGAVFNRTLNDARKHVRGERYQRALARYEAADEVHRVLFRLEGRLRQRPRL